MATHIMMYARGHVFEVLHKFLRKKVIFNPEFRF